ncbi:MAG TPA: FoF1 ATP synthase subunit gamma, partial [Candidatus Omnitrophota bacterium]|nr:FoF1 ATP synthase subunit gamma [Candidatus Omnitrophota bacterium]
VNMKQYFAFYENIFATVLANSDDAEHPMLAKRKYQKVVTLCVVTSDTGLCGSYNNNLIREAEKFIKATECKTKGVECRVDIVAVGKKGQKYFKRAGMAVKDSYLDFHGKYAMPKVDEITTKLVASFMNTETDAVYVAYTNFESSSRFRPAVQKILDIERNSSKKEGYLIAEPEISVMLDDLLPEYIKNRVRLMFLNSFASEHASRVLAMGEANKNAKELLEQLILFRNKLRQAGITNEIIEIVSSANAIKG